MSKDQVRERTTTESTFEISNQKETATKKTEEIASSEQEIYQDSPKQFENIFQAVNPPELHSALASITKADIGRPNHFITVSDKTPLVLTLNGLPQTKIAMYRDKIARALYLEPVQPGQRFQHGHSDGLDKDIIQRVFKELANPYYVFASKDGVSMVGVYDINDRNAEPVIIAFNYNTDRNGVEANWVKSLYGKKEQGIERWAEEGLLRYVNDKEKAAELSITLQMRVMGSSAAYTENIMRKSEIVNGYFVQELGQEYNRGNGGRKMENNGKEANTLEPFVLTNVEDRHEFYTSIGIDPAEPLFAEGKSLQDITSYMAGPQEYDESGFITRKEYVLSADDVLYAAFVSDKDHEQGTPLSSIHGIDSFLDKKHFALDGSTHEARHLFYKALAEREKFLETQKDLKNQQQIDAKVNGEETRKSYNQIHTEKILDTIKNGTAPFLGQSSNTATISIVPQAIRSAETGRAFRGMNQIIAQIMTQEKGGKDTELITYEQAKRHGAGIKKGATGINLTTFDAATMHQKVYRYYPKSAVYNQEKLPVIPEQKRNPGMVVQCDETTPDKYLGHYLAATSLGARFETTKATRDAFRKNLEEDISHAYAEKRYTRIFELGNKASVICQNTMSEIGEKARETERIRQKAFEVKSRFEPYNPVTGEKFMGIAAKKAAYVMETRQSHDPRFLELSDILKAGLSLKDTVKEPLIISDKGKSRFFYNAKDIEGIPPMKVKTISLAQQQKTNSKEMEL